MRSDPATISNTTSNENRRPTNHATTMTLQRPIDGDMPGICQYVRSLYSAKWFPKLEKETNRVYVTSGVGRASVKNRQYLQGDDLQVHLKRYFPHRPIHHATLVSDRALNHKHKQGCGQAQIRFGREEDIWNEEKMRLCAKEFEVPTGTKILLAFPDLFDRDILRKHVRFQIRDNAGKVVGVRTLCPYCLSNKHVEMTGRSGYKDSVRTIAGYKERIPVICPIGYCNSPTCGGDKSDPSDQDLRSQHSFHVYMECCWKHYPDELKERYEAILWRDVSTGDQGQTFVTEELCCELLHDSTIISKMAADMKDSFRRFKRCAISDYLRFIEDQGGNSTHWPDFGSAPFDKVFLPPSRDTLGNIFDAAFELVYPYLKRDLFMRTPGRFIRWDATFDFAKKTMGDEESGEEFNALVILFGEYGHILLWAFAGAEGGTVYQQLHYFLKKRCEHRGRVEKKADADCYVNQVEYGYSDVCCEGLIDPWQHWFLKIWPHAKAPPKKDLWHGEKKVTDSTRGTSHELHITFTKGLACACLKYDEASQREIAVKYLEDEKRKSKKGNRALAVETAIPLMMERKCYRTKVKNFVPDIVQMTREVNDIFKKISIADQRKKQEAESKSLGYKSYVLKPVAGIRRGTELEVKNFIEHIEKGCFADPLGINEMNIPLSDSPHTDFLRMRGTSPGESANKCANKLTADIGRQSGSRGHKRLWLRVNRFNLDKDRKIQNIIGIDRPCGVEWYLHEMLLERKSNLSEYSGIHFPPVPETDYDEPIGIEYLRYKEWSHVQTELDALKAMELSESQQMLKSMHPYQVSLTQDVTNEPRQPVASTDSQLPQLSEAASMQTTTTIIMPDLRAKRPDFGQPQSVWSRKLGGIQRVSLLDVYLDPKQPLSIFQQNEFALIVSETYKMTEYDGDQLIAAIASAWNTRHLQLAINNGIGLFGRMRLEHVLSLLKASGNRVLQAQLQVGHGKELSTIASRPKKRIRQDDVSCLSYSDAGNVLSILGKKMGNNIEFRRKSIMQMFDGKPSGFELEF
jgi:hypothetical protein